MNTDDIEASPCCLARSQLVSGVELDTVQCGVE